MIYNPVFSGYYHLGFSIAVCLQSCLLGNDLLNWNLTFFGISSSRPAFVILSFLLSSLLFLIYLHVVWILNPTWITTYVLQTLCCCSTKSSPTSTPLPQERSFLNGSVMRAGKAPSVETRGSPKTRHNAAVLSRIARRIIASRYVLVVGIRRWYRMTGAPP